MNTKKNLVFPLLLAAFITLIPAFNVSADEGRYLVKSTKSFWKNALGARHNFENGFTTELSDFQVKFHRLLGLEIEPVKVLQILPAENVESVILAPTESPTATPKVLAPPRGKKVIRPVPSDQTPWGIEVIYNDASLNKTAGGDNVKVAVLDTGILTSHPDLKARILQCKDFSDFRNPVINGKCEDKNGHGTHVAGIIAADTGADGLGINGVAPAARLLIYKVCGNNGLCYSDDIAAALRMAADEKANVVNMSFGADSEIPLVFDAINYAISKGV